jgi:hypothetical protein
MLFEKHFVTPSFSLSIQAKRRAEKAEGNEDNSVTPF